MHYATFRGEATVTELVNRLYQLPAAGGLGAAVARSPDETKALVELAEDQLRRANPSLASPERVPAGLVLVVPAVVGLEHTAEALAAGGAGPDPLADVRQALYDDLRAL